MARVKKPWHERKLKSYGTSEKDGHEFRMAQVCGETVGATQKKIEKRPGQRRQTNPLENIRCGHGDNTELLCQALAFVFLFNRGMNFKNSSEFQVSYAVPINVILTYNNEKLYNSKSFMVAI